MNTLGNPSRISNQELHKINRELAAQEAVDVGPLEMVSSIPSTIEGFNVLPEYEISLPESVTSALGTLATRYNQAFSDKVMLGHVEEDSDYQHTKNPDGPYSSTFYQIDMAGLPSSFLDRCVDGTFTPEQIEQIVASRVFEYEDSMAMYNLMRGILPEHGFAKGFDEALDALKDHTDMDEVVVAAVDGDKYRALLATELGPDHANIDVKQVSGFDRYVGPDEIDELGSHTLVYARTSPPPKAQAKPELYNISNVPHLADRDKRSHLRSMSMTLNIDGPHDPNNPRRRANDTKAALPTVHPFSHIVDRDSLAQFKDEAISIQKKFGLEGGDRLRYKPVEAYGAYRQGNGTVDSLFDKGSRLYNQVNKHGAYMLQPEIPGAKIETGYGNFGFIDRVFVARNPETNQFEVFGGFRNLLPQDNREARKNNYHGNGDAVWAPIVPQQ